MVSRSEHVHFLDVETLVLIVLFIVYGLKMQNRIRPIFHFKEFCFKTQRHLIKGRWSTPPLLSICDTCNSFWLPIYRMNDYDRNLSGTTGKMKKVDVPRIKNRSLLIFLVLWINIPIRKIFKSQNNGPHFTQTNFIISKNHPKLKSETCLLSTWHRL